MLRLLADENFNGYIVRGLLRRRPDLELVRVQDVGLAKTADPVILAWAAAHSKVAPQFVFYSALCRIAAQFLGQSPDVCKSGVQ